jgi:predicted O-methyltransferase YrrM
MATGFLPAHADPDLANEVEAAMASIPVDFGGGASIFKGTLMGALIVAEGMRTIVEIGVHRGRSLVALGVAARRVSGARVWGVDPYALTAYPDPSMGGSGPAGVADWLRDHDFEAAHRDAREAIGRLGLGEVCELLRETGADAAPRFSPESIDLLHVDGNHSEEAVRADLELYLPRVRPGGVVVIDDISWASVRGAAEPLTAGARILFELIDLENRAGLDVGNDFRVCRLPGEPPPPAPVKRRRRWALRGRRPR